MPAPNDFAPFKTQEIREYWIEGFNTPISGNVADVEFVEKDDGTVETYLIIANKTRRYRAKLSAIAVTGEDVKAA